ncbi:MAG: coiled-coil domain-containing protein [Promethearchaeota archaeon]
MEDKDQIIANLQSELKLMKQEMEKVNLFEIKMKTMGELIDNLQNSMELKEDQIKTLMDSINLKTEQIKTLDSSLKIKDEKIKTMERTILLKEEEINNIKETTVDKEDLVEKNKDVEDLQGKLEILKGELETADKDLEILETENETLRNQIAASSGSKIIDSTNLEIPKKLILEKMKEILMKALHNVTIVIPNIRDLQELTLYEVRSSVNIKVSTSVDITLEEDAEILEELESLDNITIRMFESNDRYVIDRDGEELLFAVIGKADNNHLVLQTRDEKHIKSFKSLIMEAWLRSRKLD